MTTQSIDQIIARARDLDPTARATFIGGYSVKEIVELHAQLVGEPKPRTPRPVLERRVLAALAQPAPQPSPAAEAQALDEESAIVVTAAASVTNALGGDPAPTAPPPAELLAAAPAPAGPMPERDARLPPVGTMIAKRDRAGAVRCACTVEEDGIRYRDTLYRTLSGAALVAMRDLGLAGTTADGFAFWQLKKVARPAVAKAPTEALEHAWQRYRERAEAMVNVATDETRAAIRAAIDDHATDLRSLAEKMA
jgi:hypothetical protein